MKAAAIDAGYTSSGIGEVVGVKDGTVRVWWSGLNQPNAQRIRKYAQAVGKTVSYLLYGEQESTPVPSPLARSLVGWIDLIHAGQEPVEAYANAGGKPETLSQQDRSLIQMSRQNVLDDLAARGGADWMSLTEDQKLQIVEEIRRLSERNRKRRKPPAP